jgi:hypothetical protein
VYDRFSRALVAITLIIILASFAIVMGVLRPNASTLPGPGLSPAVVQTQPTNVVDVAP